MCLAAIHCSSGLSSSVAGALFVCHEKITRFRTPLYMHVNRTVRNILRALRIVFKYADCCKLKAKLCVYTVCSLISADPIRLTIAAYMSMSIGN